MTDNGHLKRPDTAENVSIRRASGHSTVLLHWRRGNLMKLPRLSDCERAEMLQSWSKAGLGQLEVNQPLCMPSLEGIFCFQLCKTDVCPGPNFPVLYFHVGKFLSQCQHGGRLLPWQQFWIIAQRTGLVFLGCSSNCLWNLRLLWAWMIWFFSGF